MTAADLQQILLQTVTNDLRHQDYKRVTDLANDYNILMTGKDIDTKLKRFNPREDEEMFEQRKRLTIAVTPAVASSIQTPFNKVPRTPPVTKKITAKDKNNNTSVEQIQDAINKFYGGDANTGGLDYWLQNRFTDLSFIDPNAWIVIEFDPFDPNTQKAQPRPFEVTAQQAINFSVVNNLVQWLIVETDISIQLIPNDDVKAQAPFQSSPTTIYKKLSGKSVAGKKYTIYGDNDAVTLTQVADNYTVQDGEELINIESKGNFVLRQYQTLTKSCPAFRVGYVYDIETKGRTYVNPFHKALCHLEKSIKSNSEFDLSTCLHTFPQKIVRLTKSCSGVPGQACIRGKLRDGSTCPTCKGTGKPVHTSGQDIVEVELPDGKDDLIPLSDFVYYVPLPVELLEFQKDLIDSTKTECHQTVFNSTALLRKSNGGQQIDPTATEVDNDMESVYDTLAPFGEKVSSVWTTIVKLIAIITDNDDKVTIIHRFPSNFKLKTRYDLYSEIKTLNDAGVSAFVIDAVEDELAQDIYADDANALIQYQIKKEHFPFPGKNFTEIQFLLTATTTLKKTKVLYTYYDEIFTEIQRDMQATGKDFYVLPPIQRQQMIDQKVQDILDQLNKENQTAFTLLPNQSAQFAN